MTRLASGDGNSLVYSAYFGGSASDAGYGISLDSVGSVCRVGETASDSFPTRAAPQDRYRGSRDGFLVKISSRVFQPGIAIRSSSNQVQLSWRVLAAEFQLQSSTNRVVTSTWVNVPGTPVPTNATLTVSLPATNVARFIRRAKP